ncbi:MAG: DUF5666 domain-containing protein [Caldimonas sp.]
MLAGTTLLLLGCGGGVDTGGTGAPMSFAQGPISGFGSIIVAGVHYDDTGADLVDDDGRPLDRSSLALGAMARIDAGPIVDSGTALRAQAFRVQVLDTLVGPVEARDVAAGTLTVLGQRVQATPGTVFDTAYAGGVSAIPLRSVVVVSGQLDPAGARVVATRIAARPAAAEYRVRAVVTQIDRNAMLIMLGTLRVDTRSVVVPASLVVGDVVLVKLRTAVTAGVWTATEISADGLHIPARSNVELEGRVTLFVTVASFSVDGVPVDASAASFPKGSNGLGLGSRVEIEGSSAGGMLIARTVKLENDDASDDEGIELEGKISQPDAVARTFVLRGVTVLWNDSTVFLGGRASDLVPNRQLAARGHLAPDGSSVIATQIHVEL